MALKDNLKRLREQAGYSNGKELADTLGIAYPRYMTYERGSWPNEEIITKIAKTLHVSVDDLLGYKVDTYGHCKAVFLDACPAYGIREQGDMLAIYSRKQEESANATPFTWESEFDFVDPTPAPHEAFDFLPLEWTPDAPPYYLPLELTRADFIAIMQRAADDWKKETRDIYAIQIYKRLGMYKRYHTHKEADAKKPADDTAGKKEG